MDDYLKSIGLQRKKIAKDGSCLFRAVAEQVLHSQLLHTQVRAQCVEFLRKNRENYEAFIEGDFEEYLFKIQDPQQWVGEVEINALAIMYKRDFWIFQEPGKAAVNITAKNFKDRVQLCFLNGNHYDCVYPLSRIKNSAICQSIVYELLYGSVCGADRSLLGICQRAPKPMDVLIDDCLPPCPSSDESDPEEPPHRQENGTCAAVVKSKGRGRGRFLSERAKRSLNPTLLRNVQFDQWIKSKKAQQKMDFCIAAGMQYSVGDRCQVRVDSLGKFVSATVKKLSPNEKGPVTVYNDEIGEIEVPVWKLRPPTETSWSTVVREKRVTNGHRDWEDRGRGRGRGKPSSALSSVPPTTAPPAGRILKQNSWPQQASVDDREAPSRKSESVSFGWTNEQRKAKEVEERNTALAELQYPDDKSFPALGTQAGGQSEGGKKRGGEKKRPQKNTRRSPVEEARSESPSCVGNGSASPPPPSPSPSAAAPPLPKPPSSVSPPASAAPAPKPSAPPSYASATAPVPSQPGTVPSTASHFSFVTPVLPAACSTSSSSSSALSSFPRASSPPTFIAPIAPSPAVAQSLVSRTTPSPPEVTHNPPAVTEAPAQTANPTSLTSSPAPRSEVSGLHISVADLFKQNPVPAKAQDQVETPTVPQTQSAPPPPQTEPVHFPQPPPPSMVPLPSAAPYLPQNEPSEPAPLLHQDPIPPAASHPQTELPNSAPAPTQDLPTPASPDQGPPQQQQPTLNPLYYPHVGAHPFPLHQHMSILLQDPLYPGFPLGDKGQVVQPPPMSTSQSGDDLPQDINILRFFFNLGVKAYSWPTLAPFVYLLPLQQTHSLQPRAPSRSPSPLYQHHHHAPPPSAFPPFNPPQASPPAPSQSAPSDPPPHDPNPYSQTNQQAPPDAFNPAHSAPPAPPTALNPAQATQAPPAAFNPAHVNPEAPPSPYNRSTPQFAPAAYSPTHPSNHRDHAHGDHARTDHTHQNDHPYPQSYPAHVHWQPPQPAQAYPLNYQYSQGYYHPHHPQHHQGAMEQPQPANGDTALGLRAARLPPAALEGSASANVTNVNGGQLPMMQGVPGFGHSNPDVGENMMLLVDPPLDKLIVMPKSGSGPGSPALYSPAHSHSSDSSNLAPFYMTHHKPSNQSYRAANPAFVPASHGAAFLHVPELMSVSVGTEEEWEEPEEVMVQFRGHRRGGGGGGYRSRGRGQYRARGFNNNNQYYSHRGRGRY